MVNIGWVERKIGRCLTEYKHPQYDELITKCIGFVTVPLGQSPDGGNITFTPKCLSMEQCWGIFPDGDEPVKLIFIVDSSD